jgi:hypothetical protein
MTINITITGIYTPPLPETRDIVDLEVNYNGNIYSWKIYSPQGVDLSQFIVSSAQRIQAEIDEKELLWSNSPKTKTVSSPFDDSTITVDIQKEEVVCPDIPDYYAKRREEYPSIGDQLGALAKGITSQEYQDILSKIEQVKLKYPKPDYIL